MQQISRAERLQQLKDNPETMNDIFMCLAEGGSMIELCHGWGVRYTDILFWVNDDAGRKKIFVEALEAQQQWAISRLLQELRALSFIDARKLFDDQHNLLPPDKWPNDIAAAVSSIEINELYDGVGKERERIGDVKKIKLFDKLKALEMLGKDLGRFVQKHEISGKLTLEELVTGSKKEDKI